MSLTKLVQLRQEKEFELKCKITFWISENSRMGPSARPSVTYRIINNEEPALFAAAGRTRVFQLCREMHAAEDLELSAEFIDFFQAFNDKYFDGSLPDYQVRVVADVFCWIESHDNLHLNLADLGAESLNLTDPFNSYYYSCDGFQPSRVDLLGRQIILTIHEDGRHDKEVQLIHHMARAATGTLNDRDVAWQEEIERLRGLGAPVGDKVVLEPGLRTGEYRG